jgi:hypothetical protein
MRDEGQQGFAQLMATLPTLGSQQATIVTGSSLTKLQLLRIARENAPKGMIQFEDKPENPE